MPIDIKKYERLKQVADNAQREADRSAGVLEMLKAKIKDEYGVASMGEAKAMLTKLKKQQEEAANDYEQRYAEFVQKYPELEEAD